MTGLLYLIACLVIPAVWGLAASWVYDRVEARRLERLSPDEDRPDMYHI